MKKIALALALLAFPAITSAAVFRAINSFDDIIIVFTNLLNLAFPVIVGLAVIFFIWSVFVYITKAGDPEARSAATGHIIAGIIGIFVIVSVWGLVNVLRNTFNLSGSSRVDNPVLPINN